MLLPDFIKKMYILDGKFELVKINFIHEGKYTFIVKPIDYMANMSKKNMTYEGTDLSKKHMANFSYDFINYEGKPCQSCLTIWTFEP